MDTEVITRQKVELGLVAVAVLYLLFNQSSGAIQLPQMEVGKQMPKRNRVASEVSTTGAQYHQLFFSPTAFRPFPLHKY